MDEWVKKMYKSSNGFGDNNQENRREIANERRRTNRESALDKRRKIPMFLSPMTPKPTETIPEEPPKKINNRLEMLKKWKQEKEKKKLELKKQQKPMFKWSKVEQKDDFNTALNYIKGKKIIKEKSRNESIRPTAHSSTSKSSTKNPVPSNLRSSATRTGRKEENLFVGTLGVTLKHSQTTTVKNASGSVKVTKNTDKGIRESKTSARHLKFTDNTSKSVIPTGITKDLGISVIAKKIKTPKKENYAKLDGSRDIVVSKKSERLLNSFPENLVENSSKSGGFTVTKSPRKMKTPRKPLVSSENSITTVEDSGAGMNNTCIPERRTRRNSRVFLEELVENLAENDSLAVEKSSKKTKTPRKSSGNSNANVSRTEENIPMNTTYSPDKKSSRNSNGFPEELAENYSKSGGFTVKKSPGKSLGTSETPIGNFHESDPEINTTYSPKRRSRRNSNVFSEELVGNSSKNDGLTVTNSTKKTRTPKKSLEISIANSNKPEENVAMNTTYSPVKRSSRNSNGFSEEFVVESFSKNESLTLPKSSKKVKTPKKCLNTSTISTPNTKGNVKIKTPRSSTSKKSARISRIHADVLEAGLQENSEISRKTILNTPKTDWKLIENDTYETSSKIPKSLRKSLSRRNYVTPNKSVENLMDQSEINSPDLRKSPRNMIIPTMNLNNSRISTSNLNSSGRKVSRMKTPRSSSSKKSARNSRLDDSELENNKTPRKNIINTPKNDWKLVENESYGTSSNKTRSLSKSLAIKSVKNYVTPIKSMENLTISSVPRNVRSPRKSTGIPSPKISVTRRKSRIHNTEVTPKLEGKIVEDNSANKPRSLRKSLLMKKNSPKPEEKTKTPVSSTKRRSLDNLEQTIELENASPLKKSRNSPHLKSQGSDYFTPSKSPSGAELDDVFVTPEKAPDEPIVYVSPFVTTSRGKSQARREFNMRKSVEAANASFSNHDSAKSPRAAAAYFTRILDAEIGKLREKCNIWDEYKNSGDLSEDACGLIDMTIGQTNLLISKKFKQFRGLIEKCRNNSESEMRIQCEDLHGFWDMIYKQVNDLNKRFANLQEMKDNNWLEEAPKKKMPKKIAKKKKTRTKSAPASSVLKETILAARRKMAKNTNQGDVEICILNEPSKNPQLDCSTPGRGILKSQNTKSEKRKTVVFKDVRLRTPKSANRNTPNQPIRRSLRLTLSGTKLNFE